MKFPDHFLEQIKPFETIYCLTSGGYHSTTCALLLKDHGFENVILLHNKTYIERKHSYKTIDKVKEITGYEYKEIYPELGDDTVWDVLRRSFLKIPEARERLEEIKRTKNKGFKYGIKGIGQVKSIFECCDILKKKPSKKFYKTINKETSIILTSLTAYEGTNRRLRMVTLRGKDTFIECLKSFGNVWFGYPFRDEFHEKKFKNYLFNKGFQDIKHTGCTGCPILVLFKHYNSPDYYLSAKASIRAGLPCFQKTIQDFIKN